MGPHSRAQLDGTLAVLPNRRDTSLPAILTFLPRNGLVPNTSRYILGPESLRAFAPELGGTKPGFDESAEAQIAEYEVNDSAGQRRAHASGDFYYATPEMARLHAQEFNALPNVHLKRSPWVFWWRWC